MAGRCDDAMRAAPLFPRQRCAARGRRAHLVHEPEDSARRRNLRVLEAERLLADGKCAQLKKLGLLGLAARFGHSPSGWLLPKEIEHRHVAAHRRDERVVRAVHFLPDGARALVQQLGLVEQRARPPVTRGG